MVRKVSKKVVLKEGCLALIKVVFHRGLHCTYNSTTDSGRCAGWTLLLKGVAGAPGDLWNLWSSPNTANTNVPAAQRLTSEFMGHYKPSIANSLDACDFDEVS